jgi:uncharacterized Fe-S cluster-containing MiaB family protein
LQNYPAATADRDRFILNRRSGRPVHDPWRYQNLIVEDEVTAEGRSARIGTVFLTGRECPWHCAMCDLWLHTTISDTPPGAIPAQLAAARKVLARERDPVTRLKLYNAGSFFDPRAVPESDYDQIASELAGLTHIIVESHPALVGPRVDRLLEALDRHRHGSALPARLEVAMGLETAHPTALEQLHKRMTIDDFRLAADRLTERDVSLRVFLLIFPPFVPFEEQDRWLLRSIDVALSCGATVIHSSPHALGTEPWRPSLKWACFACLDCRTWRGASNPHIDTWPAAVACLSICGISNDFPIALSAFKRDTTDCTR